MLKKTAWNSLPREEKVNHFLEYLKEQKIRTIPSIEVIIPRSGNFPFLKVTFLSGGDKREFNNLNTNQQNKYLTRYMTPQCIAPREKEIQTQLTKDMCEWLLAHGYHICLLYTSPSPRDRQKSRMPSSA